MSLVSEKVKHLMEQFEPDMIKDCCWFHQHPEMSLEEYETTAYIRNEMAKLGIEIQDYGLDTGLIAVLQGKEEGICVALRADIDALPVQEEASGPVKSLIPGMMHACGHDTHVASLLGAARILSEMKDELKGTVKFIFQPAEETNCGAKKLIERGCMENPKVDAIFAVHNSPEIPTGTVAVKNSPLMASVDRIVLRIKGKGGHGGIPQRNVDPVVASAAVIQAIQTIVSRNVSPVDSAVVSICSIKAGDGKTYNVTPDEVTLVGTVRAYKPEVQKMVEKRLKEMVEGIAAAYGCAGSVEYIYEIAVTANASVLYPVAQAAVNAIGAEAVNPDPSTGGEDFSEYMKAGVPGFFYWIGTRNEEKGCVYPWHSPKYQADLSCLKYGAGTYAMSVFETLNLLKNK